MTNKTITVVDRPREVYSQVTYEGTVSIDNTVLTFRYKEDLNSGELFILKNNNWQRVELTDPDTPEAVLYNACLAYGPEEFGSTGESFDLEEDML
jgi:hypothetical protein